MIYSRDFMFAIRLIFFYNPYIRNDWRGPCFRVSKLSRIYAKIRSSRINSVLQYTKNLYRIAIRNLYCNISQFFFLLIKLFIFHSNLVL